MTDLFIKPPVRNLSNPQDQTAYIQEAHNAEELFRKELDVNIAEQNLLRKRIRMLEELINDTPSDHPNYSQMVAQVNMDQIELDELEIREEFIKTMKLNSFGGSNGY
jgi:hypothetical protein